MTLPPDLIVAVIAVVIIAIFVAMRVLGGRVGPGAAANSDAPAPYANGVAIPSSSVASFHDHELDLDGATGPVQPLQSAAVVAPAAAAPAAAAASAESVAGVAAETTAATSAGADVAASPASAARAAAAPADAVAPRESPAVSASPMTAAHAPAWPTLVSADAGDLDDTARIRLLADLGIVRAPWCVPILLRACEEETDPAVRRAALTALGGFRASADARIALEHAVAANDADERAIASAALQTFA